MKHQPTLTPSLVLALVITVALVLACDDTSVDALESHEEITGLHTQLGTAFSISNFNRELAPLRRATAQFHNFDKAVEAGYDTQLTPCWYHPEFGAMGYHYGNLEFIENTGVNLLEPEAIMYEPGPAGQMRMVGLEYIVPIAPWDAVEPEPPSLLGQEFHRTDEGGIYFLHLWLWRNNPEGLFADWNPKVSCEHAEESEDRS